MEGMTDLSPAAQAVYDAYCQQADNPYYYEHSGLVAALRAAADYLEQSFPWPYEYEGAGVDWAASKLQDIANELEQFE
jgi:hypothetical protein